MAEEIAASMESDGLDWVRPWASLELPRNGASGNKYHGRNICHLLHSSKAFGYTDPRWYTFNQIKEQGYHLRKGEKSTFIEKWGLRRFVTGQDDDGQDVYATVPVFQRAFYLFNGEQIEGIDEWQDAGRRDEQTVEHTDERTDAIISRLIESSRCPVSEGADEAYYSPSHDEIRVPDRRLFRSDGASQSFLRTLVHEMAHSTAKVFDRPVKNRIGSEGYAKEELVAELASVFVSSELGFSLVFSEDVRGDDLKARFAENHLAYLQHWKGHIKDDPDAFFKAATKASEAADYLLARYHETNHGEEI